MDMNAFTIIGRLTRDPELTATKSGTSVCRLNIASGCGFGEDKETLFMQVEVWGKQAEACGQHLTKGQEVAATGRLKPNNWKDKEGNERRDIVCVANEVRFGSKPKGAQDDDRGPRQDNRRQEPRRSEPAEAASAFDY
jgi:single-strand DNA-binding protein